MMQKDVKKFLDACDQVPSEDNIKLYQKLIKEEYEEFYHAYLNNEDVEILDACMDMIWVILGFCHMKQYNIEGAWREVTDSNLSKIDSETGKVVRRADGKILKPKDWQEPNFSKFVK